MPHAGVSYDHCAGAVTAPITDWVWCSVNFSLEMFNAKVRAFVILWQKPKHQQESFHTAFLLNLPPESAEQQQRTHSKTNHQQSRQCRRFAEH